jgi:hypothetical protein
VFFVHFSIERGDSMKSLKNRMQKIINNLSSINPLLARALLLLVASASLNCYAFFVNPLNCEGDQLSSQQRQGRNAWLKRCSPELYEMVFDEADEYSFNRKKYSERLYVTFAIRGSRGEYTNPNHWYAPVDSAAECKVPAGYSPVGVCLFSGL